MVLDLRSKADLQQKINGPTRSTTSTHAHNARAHGHCVAPRSRLRQLSLARPQKLHRKVVQMLRIENIGREKVQPQWCMNARHKQHTLCTKLLLLACGRTDGRHPWESYNKIGGGKSGTRSGAHVAMSTPAAARTTNIRAPNNNTRGTTKTHRPHRGSSSCGLFAPAQ